MNASAIVLENCLHANWLLELWKLTGQPNSALESQ